MAFEIDTATDYRDLLTRLKNFATTPNTVTAAVADPGNTGNGTCSQPNADDLAPTENWTLTATSATNFTVVGTVSGARSAATVGVAYDDIVQFTITAGGVAFVSGDKFTFSVTKDMGDEKWSTNDHSINFDSGNNDRLYLQGPGNSPTDQIFVGVQTFHDTGEPYYDWLMQGYTGYSAAETIHTQMGAIPSNRTPLMLLDNQPMKYWFVGDSQRIMGVVRVSTIYAPFYFGFPHQYGIPDSYPYPLVIGGSSGWTNQAANLRFAYAGASHRGFPDPYGSSAWSDAAALQVLNGTWIAFGNYSSDLESGVRQGNIVWPYSYSDYSVYPHYSNKLFWNGDPLLDGDFQVFPLVLCQDDPDDNILGELDGVFAVQGDGVVSEDEITIAGKIYKVFQNTYHTGAHNYFAMKLE